jgi:hypothetical protein
MRTPRAVRRAAGALAAPLLLAGALAGLGPSPAQAATAGCQAWSGVQPPSPGADTLLNGVTVLSACNAWAVGSFFAADGTQQTLIEHWDGSNWSVIPSPSPGTVGNVLLSVRAASPSNIWAVGADDNGSSSQTSTLVLHWDGAQWTQQDAPSPGDSSELLGVRTVSGTEAWAVGDTRTGSTRTSVVLHFTGGQWHLVNTPHASDNDVLLGVAATSAKDVWAVGAAFSQPSAARSGLALRRPGPWTLAATGTMQTFILHWNGTTWTHVPSPSPRNDDELLAVGASSPANAIAVGAGAQADGTFGTLALRWNGKTWARVATPSPSPSLAGDFLQGVTVTSQGSAWAVGTNEAPLGEQPIIEQWNGTRWTAVTPPDTGTSSSLSGIAASSTGNIWAVGHEVESNTNQAFALHCC